MVPAPTWRSSAAECFLPLSGVARTIGSASVAFATPETAVSTRLAGSPALRVDGVMVAVTPVGSDPESTLRESVCAAPPPAPVLAVVIGTVTLAPPLTVAVSVAIETLKSVESKRVPWQFPVVCE